MGLLTDFLNGFSGGDTNSSAGGIISSLFNNFTGMTKDFSQQISFSKCFISSADSGALYSMTQTEKYKLIKEALEKCGASSTPDTSLGAVYPLIMKSVNENEYNSSQPTAHETCPKECAQDRKECGDCLKKRLAALEALYYVDHPEEYNNRISAASPNSVNQIRTKCSLCGAPIDTSMKKCSYCDTPTTNVYDEAGSIFLSSAQMVPPKQAAYDLIFSYQLASIEKMSSPEARKIMVTIILALAAEQRLTLSLQGALNDAHLKKDTEAGYEKTINLLKVKMSMSDIHYMADVYHMSVGEYLRCLFDGDPNIMTAAVYRDKQQTEQAQALRKQQMEQERIRNQELYEKQKRANDEFWERRRASYVAPQYSGGGGGAGGGSYKCCGNCISYIASEGKCALDHYTNGASYSCGFFSLRR